MRTDASLPAVASVEGGTLHQPCWTEVFREVSSVVYAYPASQGQLPASRGEEESESGPLIESGPLRAVHLSGHKWPTLRENPCG